MRSLIILVATTAVVSGLRETTPGFAVDYRTFGASSMYQDQPHREQARSFRESGPPPGQHQLQSFRQDSFREYRHPFPGREETRVFREETRGGFKDDTRIYKDENRERFKPEELRHFNGESRPFGDETRIFKDETRGFREEIRPFKDERIYRDESRGIRDSPRHFRDERPFREELRPYREEIRSYRDEMRPFRDDSQPFQGSRQYHEEPRPFRNDVRPFRDESTTFRDDRPYREETLPLRNEPRPFREESRPFKDELLYTQESQSLAQAQHRFNKEQQQRQPLSFGGHSNYLKYGNHGLGFASVPAAILPLDDNSHQLSSSLIMPEMSTTAATQSPDFPKSGVHATSSTNKSAAPNSHNSVTLAPEVASTPSHSTSGNTIDGHIVSQHRTNENLIDGTSTSPGITTAVTISTSGGANVTPKMVFNSGSTSMSDSPMGITGIDSGNGVESSLAASTNSLHTSKQGIHVVSTPSSYFPISTSPEVPEALLNYIFKYQAPEDTKNRYTYRHSLQPESFNHVQNVPLIPHQQTAKYTILPDLKISGLSAIQQPVGGINYAPTAQLPNVSYLTANSPPFTLGGSYSIQGLPSVNYARNVIQPDLDNQFSHLGQTQQSTGFHGQSNQYSPLRQLSPNEHMTHQLGQYGNFGQAQQTTNGHFNQGGLQLQLGGFGGIDYSALSSNSEASRGTPTVNLGLSQSSPDASTFNKMSIGQPMWRFK